MVRAGGYEHRRGDECRAERHEQAGGDEHAAEHLVRAADAGHQLAVAKADGLHVAGGAFDAESTEPAEQLLGAMTEDQGADDELNEKKTDVHGCDSLEKYVQVH